MTEKPVEEFFTCGIFIKSYFCNFNTSNLSTVKARRSKSFFAFSGEIAALIDRFNMAENHYQTL